MSKKRTINHGNPLKKYFYTSLGMTLTISVGALLLGVTGVLANIAILAAALSSLGLIAAGTMELNNNNKRNYIVAVDEKEMEFHKLKRQLKGKEYLPLLKKLSSLLLHSCCDPYHNQGKRNPDRLLPEADTLFTITWMCKKTRQLVKASPTEKKQLIHKINQDIDEYNNNPHKMTKLRRKLHNYDIDIRGD